MPGRELLPLRVLPTMQQTTELTDFLFRCWLVWISVISDDHFSSEYHRKWKQKSKKKKRRYIPQIVKPKGKEWREEEEHKKGRKPIHTSMLRKTLTRRGAQPDWRKTVAPQGLCGGGWQEQRQQTANRCKLSPDICRQKEQRKKNRQRQNQNTISWRPSPYPLSRIFRNISTHTWAMAKIKSARVSHHNKQHQSTTLSKVRLLLWVSSWRISYVWVRNACTRAYGAWLHVHQNGRIQYTWIFWALNTCVFGIGEGFSFRPFRIFRRVARPGVRVEKSGRA